MNAGGILGYHEASKHSPASVRAASRPLDWPNKPYPYKEYQADLPSLDLVTPAGSLGVSALDAIAGRGPGSPRPLDAGLLARILNEGAGALRKRVVSGTQVIEFRTYASAGGLYPVEVYAVTGALDGVGAGLYHYHPRRRALVRLRDGDHRGSLVQATAAEPAVAEAPLTLALTGIPWRTAWKYRSRGFRHLYWDAGMILANLLALCTAAGLPARVILGFDDDAVAQLLGLDGMGEFPLCLLSIGAGSPGPPAAAIPPLDLPARPLSRNQITYPEILAAQASGCLGAGAVAAWRRPPAPPAPAPGVGPGPGDLLEAVIRRRGSARSFDRTPIPTATLATILDRATRGIPADYAPGGSRLVTPFLIANRVQGLDPGAYAYDWAFQLLGAGDFAEQAAFLCLEQWLGHDAAATHFLMVDLDEIRRTLGDRGYRAAELEAGITAGRIYLAAEAHRLGATGLTFYDDEVTGFFAGFLGTQGEPARSCMLAVAIGPATRRLLPRI